MLQILIEAIFSAGVLISAVLANGLLSAIAAYYQWRSRREISAVNRAVNHVGDDQPTLYALTMENHGNTRKLLRWKRRFVLQTGKHFDSIDNRLETIEGRCDQAQCRAIRPPCAGGDDLPH